MNCHSKYNLLTRNARAFTIAEVVAAMVLLAMIATLTMTVINRAMFSTMDAELQSQAFEMARESMELLLSADSVEESVEYIESEDNPDLRCEIIVEPFLEPVTNQMWIVAICRSTYTDSDDEPQEIELINWITKVPKKIAAEILEQEQLEAESEKSEEDSDETGTDETDIDPSGRDDDPEESNEGAIPEDFEDISVEELHRRFLEMTK